MMKRWLLTGLLAAMSCGAQVTISSVSTSCPVANTGQTTSYYEGDDGSLETGVPWPDPRFTVITNGADEVVIDNLTGLQWVKAPHSLSGNSGVMVWNSAIDFCNNLVYAGSSDWRLPTCNELVSLVDFGRYSPALPSGHPFFFADVEDGFYWSSTSVASSTNAAWFLARCNGDVSYSQKTDSYYLYVWPVRGGQ